MSRQSGKHNQQLRSKISGGETIDVMLVIRFMLRDLPTAVYDFCLGVYYFITIITKFQNANLSGALNSPAAETAISWHYVQ